MEPISEESVLPCQCKLHYCSPCWDKALASSFSQRGQATCPSCRALVRADFDVEKRCLVFSAETVDMTFAAQREMLQKMRQEFDSQRPGTSPSAEELHNFVQDHEEFHLLLKADEMRQGTIARLRHQACPVQVKLLQQYGEANPSLLDIHANARETLTNSSIADMKAFMKAACVDGRGCLEKSDLVTQLVENSDAARISCVWASRKCASPKCVCGCSIRRLSGLERFRMMMTQEDAETVSDADIERLLQLRSGQRLVICDICESDVPLCRNSFVWTCESRNSSMLHATSYDLCEKCFVDSACL